MGTTMMTIWTTTWAAAMMMVRKNDLLLLKAPLFSLLMITYGISDAEDSSAVVDEFLSF